MDIYSQGTCPEDALQDWFSGLGSKFFIVADVNGSLLDFALDDTLGAARGSGATIRFLSSYRGDRLFFIDAQRLGYTLSIGRIGLVAVGDMAKLDFSRCAAYGSGRVVK